MNREILFKGKRIDNKKWTYGYYAVIGARHAIIKAQAEDYYSVDDSVKKSRGNEIIEIDPETVFQYTGLTDKNGGKIFEGDIVSASFVVYAGKTKIKKGVVEFLNGAFSVNWNDSEEYGKNFAGYVNDIEVIGNIFDNPNLIGGQP